MNEQILVIDDSHTITKSLEIILTKWKFKVLCAYNGKSGVEFVKKFKPDVIFLDIDMPDMNGFDTLIEIKKLMNEEYSSTVIMLSGHNSTNDVIQAMKNGANDYIVKPFDEQLLS
ncbi:MAG: response regulator, partial [Spirochaetia bacterium]|nr:response regulator [Spirochaetia bacterium]